MANNVQTNSATISKTTEAYRRLKKLIKDGHVQAGERMSEAKMANLFGLRRGPVREAMLRLEIEGVLARGKQRSRVVNYLEDISREEAIERSQLREMIESMAARLAALNMTGHQINELHQLEDRLAQSLRNRAQCRENNDKDGHARASVLTDRASRRFHDYLIANCGNSMLFEVWKFRQLMPLTVRSSSVHDKLVAHMPRDVSRKSWLADVIDAIASHDPDLAERTTRERIKQVTKALGEIDWQQDNKE